MSTPLLAGHDLDVSYGRFPVIKKAGIEIGAGEIRALIGPNGAGKSTFLKALSGEQPVSAGRIEFNGKRITSSSARHRRHLGISRSFQTSRLMPEMSAVEQLTLAEQAFTSSRYAPWGRFEGQRECRRKAENLIELMDLSLVHDTLAGQLSYADQRKLEVAIALAGDPKILLLDEPTSGMSREESIAFADVVAKLREVRGVAILLVEHDLDVVFRIADGITVLAEGEVMSEGSPESVIADPNVRRAYLGV